jgi:hypothetical protein
MDSVSRSLPEGQLHGALLNFFLPDAPLAETALDYARLLRWFIFPLKAYGKRPRIGSHGLNDATRELKQIETWWKDDPQANIGIDCGRSNLLVIDVDPRNGGDAALLRWTAEHGTLPDTQLVARTPSGGVHYYYTTPPDWRGRKGKLCQGVDIQAAGGYVVAPPSVTLDGRWEWAQQ